MKKPGQRLGLGLQPLRAPFGLRERTAYRFERLARSRMRRLRAHRRSLGLGDRGLRAFRRLHERRQVRGLRVLRAKAIELSFDRGHLTAQADDAIRVLAHGAVQRMAARREIGELAGQFVGPPFRTRESRVRFGNSSLDAFPLHLVCFGLVGEGVFLRGKPREHRFRIGGEALFADEVVVQLNQPPIELRHPLLGALFLALECLACHHQPLQSGRRSGLRFAPLGERRCRQSLAFGRLRLLARPFGDDAHREIFRPLGFRQLGGRDSPAQMKQRGFGLAHLLGHGAVANCLPRLALERVDLAYELIDDIVEPGQIVLGRAQPQLRFVAARM